MCIMYTVSHHHLYMCVNIDFVRSSPALLERKIEEGGGGGGGEERRGEEKREGERRRDEKRGVEERW